MEVQEEGTLRPAVHSSAGVPLPTPAEMDRLAGFCIGHCEREKKLTFKISSGFGRSLQNVEIGDNLFTQSFPRTLSKEQHHPGGGRGEAKGVRKKELST